MKMQRYAIEVLNTRYLSLEKLEVVVGRGIVDGCFCFGVVKAYNRVYISNITITKII